MEMIKLVYPGEVVERNFRNLEEVILHGLENRGLIDSPKPELDFHPRDRGRAYKGFSGHLIKHSEKYGIGGALVSLVAAGIFPQAIPFLISGGIIAGTGVAVGAGDRFLYGNQKIFAPRLFRTLPTDWSEAYDIEANSRKYLESLVLASQTAQVIDNRFPEYLDKVKLGIMIGRTVDILSKVGLNESRPEDRVKGINYGDIVRMARNQKFDDDRLTKLMTYLNDMDVPTKEVARDLKRLLKGKKSGRQSDSEYQAALLALQNLTDDFEFKLSITGGDNLQSVGSQISAGSLRVRTDVGENCGSYAGMHSSGKDFPRVYVNDNAGPGFFTKSRRGIGVVGGNSEHETLEGVSGGVVIVRGLSEHGFAGEANDYDWPTIGISYGGIRQEPRQGEIYNGLIISLNRDPLLKGISPKLWRFREGKAENGGRTLSDSRHLAEEEVALEIGLYIKEWSYGKKQEIASEAA